MSVMRVRTLAALGLVVASLVGVVVVGVGGVGGDDVSFDVLWTSDTPRDNQFNHHAVGVGPEGRLVVAPVTGVPGEGRTLTDTSCALTRLGPRDGGVRWRWTVPASACFAHAFTEPAVGDLTGDGRPEVAVATTTEQLVVLDAAGREQFAVPLSTYGYGRPTMADLLPADGLEVVASDIDGTVVAAHADGSVAWRTDLNGTVERAGVYAAPVVADFRGDDRPEVAIGTRSAVVALSPNGTVQWTSEAVSTDVVAGPPGSDRLVTSGTSGVRALNGTTGAVAWSWAFDGVTRVHDVADVDGDSGWEVLVGTTDGQVVVLDAENGTPEWSTTVSSAGAVVQGPRPADLDGDGTLEVVTATREGTVVALDGETGAEVAAFERAVPVWTFVTPADLDGDGADEVLVRYGDGRVTALDGD